MDQLCDDLSLYQHAPLRFPAWENEPNERLVLDEGFGERLRTLKYLTHHPDHKDVIATSIQSLLQPTPSVDSIAASSRILRVGERLDLEALLRWLVEQRFHATSAVELPGEFSSRGGIIDLFAPDWERPIRVELFDDEIESIRRFEVATQRSLQTLAEIELTVLQPTANRDGYFIDFLSDDAWFVLLEPEEIQEHGKHYLSRLERPDDYHSVTSVLRRISNYSLATASSVARGPNSPHSNGGH